MKKKEASCMAQNHNDIPAGYRTARVREEPLRLRAGKLHPLADSQSQALPGDLITAFDSALTLYEDPSHGRIDILDKNEDGKRGPWSDVTS
ncbi:MAG: hypothetical protein LBI91_01775 [Spirochaetaceae bacterium]|jgi:hypothetical protein|nr:hypothetical protein [Spirochaetaceae bacterium]